MHIVVSSQASQSWTRLTAADVVRREGPPALPTARGSVPKIQLKLEYLLGRISKCSASVLYAARYMGISTQHTYRPSTRLIKASITFLVVWLELCEVPKFLLGALVRDTKFWIL
jgi:hypothetical protein